MSERGMIGGDQTGGIAYSTAIEKRVRTGLARRYEEAAAVHREARDVAIGTHHGAIQAAIAATWTMAARLARRGKLVK